MGLIYSLTQVDIIVCFALSLHLNKDICLEIRKSNANILVKGGIDSCVKRLNEMKLLYIRIRGENVLNAFL